MRGVQSNVHKTAAATHRKNDRFTIPSKPQDLSCPSVARAHKGRLQKCPLCKCPLELNSSCTPIVAGDELHPTVSQPLGSATFGAGVLSDWLIALPIETSPQCLRRAVNHRPPPPPKNLRGRECVEMEGTAWDMGGGVQRGTSCPTDAHLWNARASA